MLQRYLLIWLILLSLLAYVWPQWFHERLDPFAMTRPYLSQAFAVTMFAIGSLLPRDEIRSVIQRWPTVFAGTAIQYTVMPLAAFTLGRLFRLPEEMLLGVTLVGCVPGAMASNVLTLAARGNVSYSVSLTTLATLLSPLVVPAALYLTVQRTGVDNALLAKDAAFQLAAIVVGPVVAGHLLARRFPRFAGGMRLVGPIIANLTILWIIAVIVNQHHAKIAATGRQLALILLAINLVGYAAGFTGAKALRLPDGMRRALTLEIGLQNAGLGSVLATSLFRDDPAAALPPVLYMFGCMLTGTLLAQVWSMRSATAIEADTVSDQPARP